ncbi:hypothetical protein B0H13DRAFT_2301780 [Mycena leptocephala]|nr:hypothetical protein B0H13DRAFT_2301780 [Mycena leptocephala]
MPLLSRTRSELLRAVEYGKRDAPRIGGSQGGFIGLVVGLAIIILVSCVAIYILLRDHSPSDRQREVRRQDSRYPSESSNTPLKSRLPWSEKLGGIFGRGAPSKRTSKSGHGWIQASGDAWEADEAERRGSREMTGLGQSLDAPFHALHPHAHAPSHSTLRSESPIPRSMSPESTVPHGGLEQNQSRTFSVESAGSVRTFEGGTKFIEGL